MSPNLTHMHRDQVLLRLLLSGGEEPAAIKTAFAGTSCAGLLVLLQTSANHLRITVAALHANVVHDTGDDTALVSDERHLPADWTEREVCNTRRPEHMSACGAFARTSAEIEHRSTPGT